MRVLPVYLPSPWECCLYTYPAHESVNCIPTQPMRVLPVYLPSPWECCLYTYPAHESVTCIPTQPMRVLPVYLPSPWECCLYTYPAHESVACGDSGSGSSCICLFQSPTSNNVTPRHWSPGTPGCKILYIIKLYNKTIQVTGGKCSLVS